MNSFFALRSGNVARLFRTRPVADPTTDGPTLFDANGEDSFAVVNLDAARGDLAVLFDDLEEGEIARFERFLQGELTETT